MMEKDKELLPEDGDKTGHRKRLKARFMKAPSRTLPDYEILEMVLFLVVLRKDTKPLAKELLKKFGSLKRILTADSNDLKSVKGAGESVKFICKLLADLFSRLYLPIEKKVNVLSNWTAVVNYCMLTMGGEKKEYCRALYLDKRNALITDEVLQSGTVDGVMIYPREVAKQCLIHGATAVILVHNHPSGQAEPSKEDLDMTKELETVLKAVNIVLHDHIIVVEDGYFSFNQAGLL